MTVHEADQLFKDKGAISFYEQSVMVHSFSFSQGYHKIPKPFARYYFNAQGLDIGYFLYDLTVVAILKSPRAWGIYHTLTPIN